MAARSSTLANSTRRAVWLKTWQGTARPKPNYVGKGIYCSVLDRTANRKKFFCFHLSVNYRSKPREGRWYRISLEHLGLKANQSPGDREGRAKEEQCFALLTKPVINNDKLVTVGGRFGASLPQWEAISSQFILRIVRRGYRLEFSTSPKQTFITQLLRDAERARGLLEALGELMEQNVLRHVPLEEVGKGFYSCLCGAEALRKIQVDIQSKALKLVSN